MINIIKMDLYKMFKSRSFYILNIALIVIALIAGIVINLDLSESYESAKATETAYNEENSIVMEEAFPSEDEYGKLREEAINAMDVKEFMTIQYSGITMGLIAVFLAIFVCSELDTGFVKNIIPLKNSRMSLVASKSITSLLFILIQVGLVFTTSLISTIIVSGKINIIDPKGLGIYLGLEILLALGFASSIILISYLTKSKAAAMSIGILLALNIQTLFTGLVDKFISTPNFDIFKLSIISNSRMSVFTKADSQTVIIISIVYFILYNTISIIRVKKMEID